MDDQKKQEKGIKLQGTSRLLLCDTRNDPKALPWTNTPNYSLRQLWPVTKFIVTCPATRFFTGDA